MPSDESINRSKIKNELFNFLSQIIEQEIFLQKILITA